MTYNMLEAKEGTFTQIYSVTINFKRKHLDDQKELIASLPIQLVPVTD